MDKKQLRAYVSGLIEEVHERGDQALLFYTCKFDKVVLTEKKMQVSDAELKEAVKNIDPALKTALDKAATNIRVFHKKEYSQTSRTFMFRQGACKVGQIVTPIERVGLYVPGGKYSYPSTVLMSAIPASIAGVNDIVMVTPPRNLTKAVLYAAKIAGVKAIYKVGGPCAIAALAYGTNTIPKVDLIVGPGNEYVNEAKRQLFGQVGIDSLAGPSEVAIIADANASPAYITADLLAQVEHDHKAKAYLYSNSENLLKKVKDLLAASEIENELNNQVELFFNASLDAIIEKINILAPEHLQIMVKNPAKIVRKVRNAGALFIGSYTPTAIGDYWAGPSHVLPTAGTARFSSGLSVATFLKKTSYIECARKGIEKQGAHIQKIAEYEGLLYHKNSIKVRE